MLYCRLAAITVLSLPAVLACSSSKVKAAGTGTEGGAPPGSAPSRKAVTCEDVATAEAHLGTYVAGSWGTIPIALQALPASAQLCGSTSKTLPGASLPTVVTHIVSTIWDQQIFTFYNPLVTKLGCTLAPIETSTDSFTLSSRTSFKCTDGSLGTISATEETQYLVTYSLAK